MVRAIAEQILPIDVSNLKNLVRDEISVVKRPGKFIVVLVDWRGDNPVKSLRIKRLEAFYGKKRWGERCQYPPSHESRVGRECYHSFPPSEPDLQVSKYPAQASHQATVGRVEFDGRTNAPIEGWHRYLCHLDGGE